MSFVQKLATPYSWRVTLCKGHFYVYFSIVLEKVSTFHRKWQFRSLSSGLTTYLSVMAVMSPQWYRLVPYRKFIGRPNQTDSIVWIGHPLDDWTYDWTSIPYDDCIWRPQNVNKVYQMREWTCRGINQFINYNAASEWVSELVGEWMNEWVSEWVSESVSQSVSQCHRLSTLNLFAIVFFVRLAMYITYDTFNSFILRILFWSLYYSPPKL